MSRVANVGPFDGLAAELIETPEWRSVCTRQHSALFEGPAHVTERVLLLLRPHLRTPTIWAPPSTPLELPANDCGALVLHDASALGRDEQEALLAWLDADRRQVVAATAQPLYPLVACGLFDEALYYRLNVMLVSIDATGTVV